MYPNYLRKYTLLYFYSRERLYSCTTGGSNCSQSVIAQINLNIIILKILKFIIYNL